MDPGGRARIALFGKQSSPSRCRAHLRSAKREGHAPTDRPQETRARRRHGQTARWFPAAAADRFYSRPRSASSGDFFERQLRGFGVQSLAHCLPNLGRNMLLRLARVDQHTALLLLLGDSTKRRTERPAVTAVFVFDPVRGFVTAP